LLPFLLNVNTPFLAKSKTCIFCLDRCREVHTINEHIKNVFTDCELADEATIRNFRIVQIEGSRQITRDVKHYSLQMIIAVGFKVNNDRAVRFRKWANGIVKDYTIQGWVMDEERLKNGGTILTQEYFDRQLEKIREIRLSERRFHQKNNRQPTPPPSTTTRPLRPRRNFLPRFKTNCILRFTATRRRGYLHPCPLRVRAYGTDYLGRRTR
jgi:hypothetical protein